ncbi:MAG: hypothetical protein INQ03_01285 [Candidatus Heimdallarchaeota archaeon]|nr:hypothetical protein [Candidatus Heimdallarchaeota archaeon]
MSTMASIPIFLSSLFLLFRYRDHRDKVLGIMIIGWLSFGVYVLMGGLSYLLLIRELFYIRTIFLVILAFCVELSLSLINSNKINAWMIAILTMLSTMTIFYALQPQSVTDFVWANGDRSFGHNGLFRIWVMILDIFIILKYLYYTFKIYLNAPSTHKFYARLIFIGSIIFGPIHILVFALGLTFYIPSIGDFLVSIGVVLTSISFYKQPQLLYILPFRAHKLMVAKSNSGGVLYCYNWSNEMDELPDYLISTAFEGLTMFINETVKRGNIQEVTLDNAVVTVKYIEHYNIFFLLFSTDSSYVLSYGLDQFVYRFLKEYADHFTQTDKLDDNGNFKAMDKHIPDCFPYIPLRIE